MSDRSPKPTQLSPRWGFTGEHVKAAPIYARAGFAVVPLHDVTAGVCSCGRTDCPSAGKHPRVNSWQTEATSDAARVAEWVAEFPEGNVGLATGSPSGFWVLDVDGAAGAATLADLIAEHGPLPETAEQRTGSGGTHYLFQIPDFTVRNSARKIGPGLDVRGDGGQIVAAPSVSAKGAYRWVKAPWRVPIAPAPAWLLSLIRASPAPAQATAARPAYLPASPAELEAARDALEAHGPALEGHGGDAHTFVAAAILVNDFALTDAEALPLLAEWNETCQPPWSARDLAVKLRSGHSSASRPYGCKRPLGAYDLATAAIAELTASGANTSQVLAALPKIREIARGIADPAQHATVTATLQQLTGIGSKALALPPARGLPVVHVEDAPGEITYGVDVALIADRAALALKDHVFQQRGTLVEVVSPTSSMITALQISRVQDLMSRTTKWFRNDNEKGRQPMIAPPTIAQIVHARRHHEGIRELTAVTTAPIFLADGSILEKAGYNAAAQVWLQPSVTVSVLENPTHRHARRAVASFTDLLSDVRFATQADFSTWLCAVISPLAKAATKNAPVPLICVSAPSAGAGKSLLAGVASLIVTGNPAEIRSYNPRDLGEWGKRITAFVKAASPISVFDNVNGAFGDETIDRLITSPTWSDRILGASEAPPLPNVSVWMATGNNIEPTGDTARRCAMVRMEVLEDRPQERGGFKRDDLPGFALENRALYLSEALTILRAYHCAGRPSMGLPTWGSFTVWSDLVRNALVWAGCADPYETQRRLQGSANEAESDAHDFWISVVEECGGDASPAAVAARANSRDASTVLGTRESLSPFSLSKFLAKFVDRPRLGKRIRKATVAGKLMYSVERV